MDEYRGLRSCVTFCDRGRWEILPPMAQFPHPHSSRRAPRVRIREGQAITFSMGNKRVSARLDTLSVTGGLARVPGVVLPGTIAEIFLNSSQGQVSGIVEFLHGQGSKQAFRFLAFGDEDYERLNTMVRTRVANSAHSAEPAAG